MSWWSAITALFRPARELVEVFKPNAEHEAARGHLERLALTEQDMASLQQFAAEFQARDGRTWWDSLVDGLNRLPRPLITLGILAFFVLAPLEPVRFLEIARAYQMMPDGFWALLSVIIAFYFGGRMQLKRQDMTVKGGALADGAPDPGAPARGAGAARAGAAALRRRAAGGPGPEPPDPDRHARQQPRDRGVASAADDGRPALSRRPGWHGRAGAVHIRVARRWPSRGRTCHGRPGRSGPTGDR